MSSKLTHPRPPTVPPSCEHELLWAMSHMVIDSWEWPPLLAPLRMEFLLRYAFVATPVMIAIYKCSPGGETGIRWDTGGDCYL